MSDSQFIKWLIKQTNSDDIKWSSHINFLFTSDELISGVKIKIPFGILNFFVHIHLESIPIGSLFNKFQLLKAIKKQIKRDDERYKKEIMKNIRHRIL